MSGLMLARRDVGEALLTRRDVSKAVVDEMAGDDINKTKAP